MKKNWKKAKVYSPEKKIENLYAYLKKADPNIDEIIIRSSYVSGGWHDNEFDANAAGFDICRYREPELEARHEFSECYDLVRRTSKQKG